MEALKKYMETYLIQDKDKYTHLGMPGELMGKYLIPDEKLDEFYDKFIIASSKKSIPIVERNPANQCIIKVDFDFKYDKMERKFDDEFIYKIVKSYMNLLNEDLIFENDDDKELLECWVFMRDGPYKDKKNIKDGIHLMFPLFKTDYEYQHQLRNEIISRCSNLLRPLSNESVEKIVDKVVIETNGWMLYGGSKENVAPYELKAVFNHKMINIMNNINQDKKFLISHLSIRRDRKYLKATPPKKVMMEESADSSMSISVKQSGNEYEQGTIVIPKKKIEISEQLDNSIVKNEDNNLLFIQSLIKIMDPDRLYNDTNYNRIARYFYSITPELENDWIEYNKKLGKDYNETKCKETWMAFTYQRKKNKNLEQIATLHFWAKSDNKIEYNKIMKSRIIKRLYSASEKFTHYNIAQILYQLYRYDFVCTSTKHKTWYHFKNHRWHEMNDGDMLKILLSEEVTKLFNEIVIEIQQKIANPEITPEQRAILVKRINNMNKDILSLENYNFQENVVKMAAILFCDNHFEEKLDSNPYTIGFNNGIYDLESQEFRPGTPDDMISLTTCIDFEHYDLDDAIITEIMDVINKIIPNENLRNYLLKFLASCLCGTPLQLFHIFTGSGSNGKSVLVKMFEKSIGKYGVKLPVSFITQKRGNSGQASPELVRTKGARWVSLQEPDEDAKFNSGLLKEITGSDSISTRALFKNQIEFYPMFNPVMCCNDLPIMKAMDNGTWRRIRVVEFISKFVDDLNNTDETYGHTHVFLKDYKLDKKMEVYSSVFIFILLKIYYPKYLLEGLSIIEEVDINTKKYKEENDIFNEFFTENIRKNDKKDKNDKIVLPIKDAYERYKYWYSDKLNEKPPTQSEFKKSMSKKAGKYSNINHGWSGFELINQDSSSNDGKKYEIASVEQCEAL